MSWTPWNVLDPLECPGPLGMSWTPWNVLNPVIVIEPPEPPGIPLNPSAPEPQNSLEPLEYPTTLESPEPPEMLLNNLAQAGRLQDPQTPQTPPGDIVRCHDPLNDDPHAETEDLASKFMFFATFEKRQKQEAEKKRKVFRITPPREEQVPLLPPGGGAKPPRRCMAVNCAVCKLRGLATEDIELGRDPNLIRSTDNYQDEVDCRKTKSILTMFKKMEAKNTSNVDDEDEEAGPRPLHRFTPPPEGEDYDDEYTDEDGDYTDEEDDYTDEEDGNEERAAGSAPYKDELLQMSARKAAELRAKFEKWELEETRHNDVNKSNGAAGEDEEAMPSLDTARNLKAMFEEKAQEAAKPQVRERAKVNRFVKTTWPMTSRFSSALTLQLDPNPVMTLQLDPNLVMTLQLDPNLVMTLQLDPNLVMTLQLDPDLAIGS
ncbi:hypothetical protein FHG87_020974 [Trinorchestia longiramus]|nr:hypothetical protein FHG87_020974 [Trinorchestia longiramus]